MMFLFYPGGYFVFLHGYRKETGLALMHGDLKLRILFRNWKGESRPILNFIRSVDDGKMCDSVQNIGNYLIKQTTTFLLTFITRTNCKDVLFWKSEKGYFQIKILQNSSAWYISKKGKIAFSKSTKAYKVPDP